MRAKKVMKSLALAAATGVLAACATSPDKIGTAYVSAFKYAPYSCEQISFELEFVAQRTQALYDSLRAARRNDNWQAGVGVILLPTLFALEGGDGVEASEYASLKGEFEALLYASMQKRCGLETMSPEAQVQSALNQDTMIDLPDNRRVSLSQMLGLLEQAYAQNLISEQELNAARDTAFMILGSNSDGRNLPQGSLDNLYSLINELELSLPRMTASALPSESSAAPNAQSLDSLARRVEGLGQQGQLQSLAPAPAQASNLPIASNDSPVPSGLSTIELIDEREREGSTDSLAYSGPKSLESILREYAFLDNYYVDELPQWKLVQFFNKAGIANTTVVLAYIDTTIWGSGKNGVLFTPDGIYYSNDFVAGVGGTFFISYDDIVEFAQPNYDKRYFYLGYGALPKRGLIDFVGNDTDLDALLAMFEEIQTHYQPASERFPMALMP